MPPRRSCVDDDGDCRRTYESLPVELDNRSGPNLLVMVMVDMSASSGHPSSRHSSAPEVGGLVTVLPLSLLLLHASFPTGPDHHAATGPSILGRVRSSRDTIPLEWAGGHGRRRSATHRSRSACAYAAANAREDAAQFSFDAGLACRSDELGLGALDRLRERGCSAGPLAIDSKPQETPMLHQIITTLPALFLRCRRRSTQCGRLGSCRGRCRGEDPGLSLEFAQVRLLAGRRRWLALSRLDRDTTVVLRRCGRRRRRRGRSRGAQLGSQGFGIALDGPKAETGTGLRGSREPSGFG